MEKTIRNEPLKKLHAWLEVNIDGYIALCEAGSTTAGDPWVAGRTDRDITIVVARLTDGAQTAIRRYLKNKFGDSYLFIIFDEGTFLTNTTEQDLSMKYRGQTLFGIDVIAQKPEFPRKLAAQLAQSGLRSQERKLRTRLMNSEHWSIEHVRDYMYPEFKRLIMWLAAKKYAETGKYPRSRAEVATAYNSQELRLLVKAISNIDGLSRREIINAASSAVKLAQNYA